MRIFSIFVISENGLCLFQQSFTANAPPYGLITGLLTAVQAFVFEVTGDYPTELSTGGFSFHLKKYGPLTFVLTTSSTSKPIENLNTLGLRFMTKFGAIAAKWKGKVSDFHDFKYDVEEVLGKSQIKKRIDPYNPLTGMTLLTLDIELQDVAQALIQSGEASSEELTKITGKSEYITRMKLEKLLELGHVGRTQDDDDFIYFVR